MFNYMENVLFGILVILKENEENAVQKFLMWIYVKTE